MSPNIKNILLNNWSLALLFALAIVVFVRPVKNRYLLKLQSTELLHENSVVYFNDLDGDGISEKILFDENQMENACVRIFNPGILGQLNAKCLFSKNNATLFFNDFDFDGIKEIFFLGQRNDSLLLNVISFKPYQLTNEIFIEILTPENDALYNINKAFDLNSDGINELIIEVNSGFMLEPRKLYAVFLNSGKIIRTPQLGPKLLVDEIDDLDNDGHPEIICGTFTSRNYENKSVAFTDSFSWVMVFDRNLQLKFNPVLISKGKVSVSLNTITLNHEKYILLYVSDKENLSSFLNYKIINPGGNIIKQDSLNVKNISETSFSVTPFLIGEKLAIVTHIGEIYWIDENFEHQFYKRVPNFNYANFLGEMDLTNDGKHEKLFRMGSTAEFAIADPRFRHFTRINIVGYSEGPINKGVKLNANKPPLLYIQAGKKLYLLSYNENPLWYFRIVIWLAIYLLIYVFLELLQNIQKKRIEARLKTQQQIRELQFKVLTSQLNPHFTFNALNTISSSIYDPEKPEIYDRFTMFSRLIRSILSDSDKVACSLENEVSFTEDFLKIQKLRFKDAFWYEIKIAKNVNRLSLVPKLIIQIFVENAIKHAFPNEYGKDKVEIVVTQKNTDILIEVTDNGLGRKKASEIVKLKTIYSTGVGLRVIQEYIDLLNEQNKNKITITFTDLHSENQAKGTCVRIKIPVRFDYSVK